MRVGERGVEETIVSKLLSVTLGQHLVKLMFYNSSSSNCPFRFSLSKGWLLQQMLYPIHIDKIVRQTRFIKTQKSIFLYFHLHPYLIKSWDFPIPLYCFPPTPAPSTPFPHLQASQLASCTAVTHTHPHQHIHRVVKVKLSSKQCAISKMQMFLCV